MTLATVVAAKARRMVALQRAANDLAAELSLAGVGDDELLDLARGVERERRRAAVADQVLLGEIDRRQLAHGRGCKDTRALLVALLRIDAGEAKARLQDAADLGPRLGLTGEQLGPIFPAVAGAVAAGDISPVAARIVTAAVEALPADVQTGRGAEVEGMLVEQAGVFAPPQLRTITRRLVETYDQDGRLASDADRQRRRHLDVHQHADGTVSGSFLLDPVAGEALLTVLDSLAKPVAGPNGERDPRTPGQRRHDGLKEALLRVLRGGELPDTGGITTTIVVTMTLDQLEHFEHAQSGGRGRGSPRQPRAPGHTDRLVSTGHGALLGLDQVEPLGDAQVFPVVLGPVKRIEAYGSSQRFFTASQRLAMHARDRGCSFPGCTVPAAWCDAHHVQEWVMSRRTSVDNGTLLCGYHHAHFEQLGYTCTMRNGVPHWTAPLWADPIQTPVRNVAHDPCSELPD